MKFSESLVFYLLIGLAVAVAVFLRNSTGPRSVQAFRLTTAVLFWPLHLPILLARTEPVAGPTPAADDGLSSAIAQVESELDSAMSSLDGWAEDVLAREQGRIRELRGAWTMQAARIRELDRLLLQPSFAGNSGDPTSGSTNAAPDALATPSRSDAGSGSDAVDRRHQSELGRRKNIDRLRSVRRQAHDDLLGTLAWVRELVSMIHLAKYTGAPASRAEELVAQIAAAVEGVSAVTWQDRGASLFDLHNQDKEFEPWESFGASTTSSQPT